MPDADRVLLSRVPLFVRRALHVGCGAGILGESLRRRSPALEVYGIETEAALAEAARSRLNGVVEEPAGAAQLPFPAGYFDCVLMSGPERYGESLGEVLAKLAPLIGPRGLLLLPIAAGEGAMSPERFGATLAQAGLAPYMLGPWAEASITMCQQGAVAGEDGKALCCAVWPTYDPVSHAGEYFDKGRPDYAFEILCGIPAQYRQDPRVEAALEAEKQLCLLAMNAAGGALTRLHFFWSALQLFYHAAELDPKRQDTYLYQAEFWSVIGDDDMAARTLRSIYHVTRGDDLAQRIARYTRPRPARDDRAPQWRGVWRPRILLLMPADRPHYGIDVLYDGLCLALGKDRVDEYPWKPTLHGGRPEKFAAYPCMFNWPGEPMELESLCRRLGAGAYDVILFADIERSIDRASLAKIMLAAGDLPVFLLDSQDDCVNHVQDVTEWLWGRSLQGYFKRELLACADFGANVFPCPFAYADGRVPPNTETERTRPLFWAGQWAFGLRTLYLSHLESLLGQSLGATYTQDEYAAALLASRIGISIFGAGFDCVRYWELPAHGALLLAERPPIRIPHDFQDGETAVFFDDLKELEEKIQYYLSHPEQSAAIARAGHEHFLRYHTGSARARQVLAYMEGVLCGGDFELTVAPGTLDSGTIETGR